MSDMNRPPGDAVTGLQEAACFPERRKTPTVLVFSSQAPDDGLVQCPPHLINVDSMFYVIFTF